jgi:hypothetical protein
VDDLEGDWLAKVQGQWELIKKVCKQRKRTVAALLQAARPIMASPGETLEVVLQAEYKFHYEKLREPDSRGDVEWAMQQVLERPCHVRMVLAGSGGAGGTPRSSSSPNGGAPASGGHGPAPKSEAALARAESTANGHATKPGTTGGAAECASARSCLASVRPAPWGR